MMCRNLTLANQLPQIPFIVILLLAQGQITDDGIERRTNLMAHAGEEIPLGSTSMTGRFQSILQCLPLCDILAPQIINILTVEVEPRQLPPLIIRLELGGKKAIAVRAILLAYLTVITALLGKSLLHFLIPLAIRHEFKLILRMQVTGITLNRMRQHIHEYMAFLVDMVFCRRMVFQIHLDHHFIETADIAHHCIDFLTAFFVLTQGIIANHRNQTKTSKHRQQNGQQNKLQRITVEHFLPAQTPGLHIGVTVHNVLHFH